MIESKIQNLPEERYPSFGNNAAYLKPCREFAKLRKLLDAAGIQWEDASEPDPVFPIHRTHGDGFSAIWGAGSYGREFGLLEVMVAGGDGDPVGWLTADEALELVLGGKEADDADEA